MHPLTTQESAVPRECGESARAYDPMTRHSRIVASAHDVPDGARGERASGDHRDEAVGRDAPWRDAFHDAVDGPTPGVCRRPHRVIKVAAPRRVASSPER